MQNPLICFACSILLASTAAAQGPGATIDAVNQTQSDNLARLEADRAALAGELQNQVDINRVQGLELIEIKKRLDALETAPPVPTPIPPPSGNGPRTALNPSHSSYWSHEDAFLNHVLVTGKDYALWVKSGQFDEASARFVALPATGPLIIGLVRDGVTKNADHYAGKWVLDWQGDCDVSMDSGSFGPIAKIGRNRIEETYDPAAHGTKAPRVVITRIGAAGCSDIRFYRVSHEPLLAVGEVFDPAWVADAKRFDVLRLMDWTGVNGDYELAAIDRPKASRPVWFGGRVPDWALVKASMDAGTELWLNAPGLLGCPPALADTLRNRTGTQAARVAAVAASFDTIMASNEPLAWARGIIAELNARNYPVTRPLYIEYDNEVWNFTFAPSTEFNWGIGQALNARQSTLKSNMRTGYGWQSARYANAFAQALAEGGRSAQVWTMVVASQTADVTRTTDALKAVSAFGGSAPMSRYGVATTHYYSGGFRWRADNVLFGSAMTQAAWEARWLSDFAADHAALRALITAYFLDPVAKPQNIAWIAKQTALHKTAASAAGAGFIGTYEGDSHDILSAGLSSTAGAVALFREWHESADHGRVIAAAAAALRAIDSKLIMANYAWCAGGRAPDAPWTECAPWDKVGLDDVAWRSLLKP